MPQRQKSIGYRRRQFSTAVEKRIEAAVERECARYDVGKSFVIANALAFTFGIDTEDNYKRKTNGKAKSTR